MNTPLSLPLRGEDEGEGENTPSADADTPLKEGNALAYGKRCKEECEVKETR